MSQNNLPADQQKNSGLAIASLVLGILAFLTFGITALPGIILGIVAMGQIRHNSQLKGSGMAVAGITIGAVSMFIFFIAGIMGAIMYPVFSRARDEARGVGCMANVKRVSLSMQMYASEWNDSLPPADGWNDKVRPYVGNDSIFRCPSARSKMPAYAVNSKFASKKSVEIASPDKKVLIFETEPGRNKAGGSEMMLPAPRHADKYSIGFADGHAKSITDLESNTLQWE
ncbi:MAG: DUF4190 domain-containing protein [Armatimonadota bacterium]